MAGESKEGSSIPYSGIVGAILVVAAVVAQHPRLDSARPVPAEAKVLLSRSLHQDVDARLWQDPIAAVAQFRERKRQEAIQEGQLRRRRDELSLDAALPPDDEHNLEGSLKGWLKSMQCKSVVESRESVRLLMPMLIGGRDEESAEMRRRTRYAVVSGLINAKYNPDDADAIGYAHVPAALRGKEYKTLLPEILPFEWFGRRLGDSGKKEWVLVLWLDETKFQEAPLSQLRALVDALTPSCGPNAAVDKGKLDATVLGPVYSEMLALVESALQEEILQERKLDPKQLRAVAASRTPLRFVSASATMSLSPLPSSLPSSPPPSQFYLETPSGRASFARVIGPDDKLIDALEAEVRLRLNHHVVINDKRPAVVVISEHDTDYGRDFIKALEKRAKAAAGIEVAPFSYLRQIDGGRGGAQRTPKSADKDKDGEKSETQAQSQPLRSHGSSQIDYLDRLVRDIERYGEEKNRDVVAIGIFGNDVYDKLLILRALRPAFPKAQFLTTDLDARLLDPEEVQWTRNLVVATNFGLTLDRQVQGGASPFRDGYQTATYFATWLYGGKCATRIVKDYGEGAKVPPWMRTPLLFEIGRHGPVPLQSIAEGKGVVDLKHCDFGRELKLVAPAAVRIQPPLKRPELSTMHRGLLAIFAAIVLALLIGWVTRYPVPLQAGARADTKPAARAVAIGIFLIGGYLVGGAFIALVTGMFPQAPPAFTIAGIIVAIGLCVSLWSLNEGFARGKAWLFCAAAFLVAPAIWLVAWTAIPALRPNDEPFAWVEGISVWPTQLLRLFAAVFASFSIWYIGAASARSMRSIGERIGLEGAGSAAGKDGHKFMANLWDRYAAGRSTRIGRTIVAALTYFAICVGVMAAFDARPGIPLRGEHAPEVAALLGFASFLGTVLLMGMMFGCGAFILKILMPASKLIPWFPNVRVTEFRDAHKLPDLDGRLRRFIDCCLMVELVAERSRSLVGLIYLPFAVFAVLVVARSPLFDNWDTPVGLLVVLGLPFIAVIGYMMWLRYATMVFHRKAIRKAQQQLIRLRGESGVSDAQLWQLDRLFEQLRDERRGSFQNLLLQPMVRALLFPLGGISGLELIEQFALNR